MLSALVQGSAARLAPVVARLETTPETAVPVDGPVPVADHLPGYRLRVVDGNHLPASEKRVKPLRGVRSAALPGQALVVYDPATDLVVDLVPGEDAHAGERRLLRPLIERAGPGEVRIAELWDALHSRRPAGHSDHIRMRAPRPPPTIRPARCLLELLEEVELLE